MAPREELLLLTFLAALFSAHCAATEKTASGGEAPDMEGPYLGMRAPGRVPELFAPGVVSTVHHEHSGAIFSPDGDELFWTLHTMPLQGPAPAVVLYMKRDEGSWTPPEVAWFSGRYDDDVASISPDGRRLYVSSRRPHLEGDPPRERADIWVLERTPEGWSNPRALAGAVNTENHESDFQETRSGTAYLVGYVEGVQGNFGILRTRSVNGEYTRAEPLPSHINSEHVDWCPYVDPDEELLIFSSNRPGGYGQLDLYVSFRRADDTWGEPINLGPNINSDDNERFPHMSPDAKYLFFLSKRTPIVMPPDRALTFTDLKEMSSSITNGLSNIYWVDASFLDGLR
jgi:dipeptidyl aminopeptidase/acylaminoacyl peptidase